MVVAALDVANASSTHAPGVEALEIVEEARDHVASLLGCSPSEVIFTSGATESNNLALFGILEQGGQLVTSTIEHHSVLECIPKLERRGVRVAVVEVDRSGAVDPADIERNILSGVGGLVSIMSANNETGVVSSIDEISEATRRHDLLLHSDAAQAVGKISVDVRYLGVDLMSISSHKMGGPLGVGGLFVSKRAKARLEPVIHGGGQEFGLRSGTLNVPAIAGFGEACRIAAAEIPGDQTRIESLRDLFEARVQASISDVWINGSGRRIPNTSSVGFRGALADAVLAAMPNIAASAGSACSSGAPGASHVLRAIGISEDDALCCMRFSLSKSTSHQDIDLAVSELERAVSEVRLRLAMTDDVDLVALR